MKKKKDKTFYISRAKRDLRDLFIYFNITRPQYEKAYFKDGKFSLKELVRQMEFLDGWSNRNSIEKKSLAGSYVGYSRTFNYVFGIPRELISKVTGEYKDDAGRKHRIGYEDIIDDLVKEGFIKVVNAGRKFDRTEDGQYRVKCWWCKKYIMANKKQWFKLMAEDRYRDINRYGSDRLRKIIFKWNEPFRHKDPIEKEMVLDMFNKKGIGVDEAVVVWNKIFGIERDRLVAWLKKFESVKDTYQWHEEATKKERVEFWSRLYLGNIRSGEYDEQTKNWIYSKYKEAIKD